MRYQIIDDDPGKWSLSKLEAHARKWLGLPLTEARSVLPVMDGDIALLHHLADQVLAAGPTDLTGMVEFDIDVYLEPWPADRAGELIEAWRAERAA